MNKTVIEIPSIKKEVLRVAAYCRVSTAYEEQQTSLNSQIQYYTDYINNHECWVLARVSILSRRRVRALITEPHSTG